jgi:transcriptional regulator with XRE-family HTH domain
MDQEELGLKAGVSGTYISLIENGNRTPSWDALGRICYSLDVSITLVAMLLEKDHVFVKPIISLAYSELAKER